MDSIKNSVEVGNCDYVLVPILQYYFSARLLSSGYTVSRRWNLGSIYVFTRSLKKDLNGRSKILAVEPLSKQ